MSVEEDFSYENKTNANVPLKKVFRSVAKYFAEAVSVIMRICSDETKLKKSTIV